MFNDGKWLQMSKSDGTNSDKHIFTFINRIIINLNVSQDELP